MYQKLIKPLIDFCIALIGVIILSPVLGIVTLGLYIVNNGKPFFFQVRPGKQEKLFKIIKFKTMTDKTDADGELLPDKDRLTKLGKIIRKTSIDEIPQLFNIIKGDMSIIGPRPLLVEYLNLYNDEQKKRHLVKPGMTGWAQVNGRNAISWQEKFKLDIWYTENISFSTDLKIFFLTIKKVILSDDINAKGQATMRPFIGNS